MPNETLSLDQIDNLLATVKTRGEYKPVLASFFASGDLAINLSERFPGKEAQSLRNSVKINLTTNFQNEDYKLMVVGEAPSDPEVENTQQVILVNMKVYKAQKAAQTDSTED